MISSIPLLTESHLSLAKRKTHKGSSRKLRLILWNMFTGNIPYKDIFKISLDIRLQISLLFNTISLLLQKLKKAIQRFDLSPTDAKSTESSKR